VDAIIELLGLRVGCTVSPGFTFEGFELAPPGWSPP
jgi:predicted cupin superfamily sugar epimerase